MNKSSKQYLNNGSPNWTRAVHQNVTNDDVALDAHWGAIATYNYWKNMFGRKSYSDKKLVGQ